MASPLKYRYNKTEITIHEILHILAKIILENHSQDRINFA